jgi:hypothetical protein
MPCYVYVLDGIATANGEVGISGSPSSPYCNVSPPLGQYKEGQRQQPVNSGIVVNIINFNFASLITKSFLLVLLRRGDCGNYCGCLQVFTPEERRDT